MFLDITLQYSLHGPNTEPRRIIFINPKLWAIYSDTHQLQLIKLHHFKVKRFKSI